MVNLVPQEDQIILKIEYKKRFIAVLGAAFFVGFGLLATLLLPVPFSLSLLEKEISQRERFLRERLAVASGEEALKNLAETESKANFIIASEKKRPSPAKVIKEISGLRSQGIFVTGVEYNAGDAGNIFSSLNLSGTARYRDNLVNFIDTLKKDAHFKDVSIPIQTILKSEKIDFQISMTSDF